MYFLGKLKKLFLASLFIIFSIQNSNAIENKILFKIDNEIITTIDIYDEIRFLKAFNPEIKNLTKRSLLIEKKLKKRFCKNHKKKIKENSYSLK